MNKRIMTFASFLLVALLAFSQAKAKYVFYFIGDGMGVNQVNATETYQAALEGKLGIKPLCFPSFPNCAVVNTSSASADVTDSAAAGTALATGHKTKNGTLGMLKDRETPVNSIAQWAHDAGAAVGVTTSVTVDHATPAAFYAHVGGRGETFHIGQQLVATDFDFFAGSDFDRPQNPNGGADLYQQAKESGYTVVRGYKEYQKRCKKADKMILLQSEEASKIDRGGLPYAIDQTSSDLNLADITRAAIHFLTKKQQTKDGFFLMVEGGKIDWLCHANDPAFIPEVIDMDNAVKVAYEFYQQHPDETLIVVTADHETGGFVLGRGGYNMNLKALSYQRMSISQLGRELHNLHEKYGEKYGWDVVQNFLKENFGLWDTVKLSDDQTARLQKSFQRVIEGKGVDVQSLYQKDSEFAGTVNRILSECAKITWGSNDHTAGYVPCFSIGVGAEELRGRLDNTDLPVKMAKAAGWPIN
ncbi:MAG: alkaline phosphatase [Bacteroidaceae bacterium]|nr:alkaline phosphatase [Bacteroidaceae bacterium]